MNRRSVTKNEVARRAGVSHMTVTRVLSNFPYVTGKTRKKVLRACKELEYRHNIVASSLRNKKSFALGVVVPTFTHTFYARFLNSVEEECRKTGYHIIVLQGRPVNSEYRIEWSDIEFLLARQIDGLLINLVLPAEIVKKLKKERIPLVFTDVPPADSGFSFVGTADFEGGRFLTNHLIKSGHRKIAFFSGTAGHYTYERRLAGYRTALAENKLPDNRDLIIETDHHTEGGYKAAGELLRRNKGATAVICANDYIAIGALSAFNQNGIKVPEEISVAGFTGDEIGAYTIPPLTTMNQPIEGIGRKAVEILLARVKDPKRPIERVLLPAVLLERASVKKIQSAFSIDKTIRPRV